MDYYGRTVITSNVDFIDRTNILDVIEEAAGVHDSNVSQINYLYEYYKGNQPVYQRTKSVRSDILNMIVENNAKEVVDFKTGYRCTGPIVYTSRNGDEVSEDINILNGYMETEGREGINRRLYDWQHICGTSYLACFPDEYFELESDMVPFELYCVDPRKAFVIYSTDISERPLAGCYTVVDAEGETIYNVYTPDRHFRVKGDEVEEEINGIGRIPIIEYPLNEARLGAFESALDILDAINELDSDRLDGVQQFIQSLVVTTNVEFEEGTTQETIRQTGIVALHSRDGLQQDIKVISEQLDQGQTQTLKNDLKEALYAICSMPYSRRSSGSTADTGVAVVYRDGWYEAEADAQSADITFKQSETELLKVVLSICSDLGALEMRATDIKIKPTRRNYENIESKVQVLNTMLQNPKIAPKLAFIYSGLFPDSEEAYRMSIPQIEESERTVNATEDREV